MLVLICAACVVAGVAMTAIVVVLRACPRITRAHLIDSGASLDWCVGDESDEWRLRRRGHYVARYRGSSATAAALTSLAAPISVREAVKTCRQLGLSCELRGTDGEVVASIDKHGTVRIDVGDESG